MYSFIGVNISYSCFNTKHFFSSHLFYKTQYNSMSTPEEKYDYVIIGTGLVETAVSSILSSKRNTKILHLETNSMYGSEFSTLQYTQLLNHFRISEDNLNFEGQNRLFNIDLTPKLLLQDSPMKDFLLKNNIQDLVNFTSIEGSYLYTDKIHNIPTNETQSLKSSAISFTQKYRVIKFFWNARSIFERKTAPRCKTMAEEFKSFGLNEESIDFIGHAIALNLNDEYLNEEPMKTYERIIRYVSSIVGYENSESPYIYPLYGLSELCQAFSRKSALNGTVFMLNAQITAIADDKISIIDPNGVCCNVKAGKVIMDPKYWPGSSVKKEIIRCILIMKQESNKSRNIIFLKRHLKREHDVFCVVLGSDELACPEGFEIAIISAVRETQNKPEDELALVLKRFRYLEKYVEVRKVYTNEDTSNIIFTKNVDESPLLDNIYDDIIDVINKLPKDDILDEIQQQSVIINKY